MSKHFGNEVPVIGIDVFSFHTPELATKQHRDYLKYDGNKWVYSLNNEPITGVVNAWYDSESEAADE